jgi:hypothetical protein
VIIEPPKKEVVEPVRTVITVTEENHILDKEISNSIKETLKKQDEVSQVENERIRILEAENE